MSTPIKFEDFKLSDEDLKIIVEGSQKYLPPDPEIELNGLVDEVAEEPTS
jgi:hypothetical protein